jgi:hypothetical protein
MHPLQDPDAVRLGDWRDLSIQRRGYAKKPVRRKANKVAVALVLLSAGAFIAISAHVAQTQDRSLTADEGSAAMAGTAELGSAPAMARMPVEFVDDWTFVYPAPLPN